MFIAPIYDDFGDGLCLQNMAGFFSTQLIAESGEDPKNSKIPEFGGRHLFENLTHGCL
jgi:hypothetical protein